MYIHSEMLDACVTIILLSKLILFGGNAPNLKNWKISCF